MMGRGVRPLVLSSWVAIGLGGASVPASADPSKQQCVDDNRTAQDLRRNGHFGAARESLRRCAVAACPALVRDDCTLRLDDLEKAQPSLMFEVTDTSGTDIIAVRIRVDGTLLTDRLDGTPLKVDPGAHVVTFEVAGRPTVTESLLVREGEAARRERVVIASITKVPADRHQVQRVAGVAIAAAGLIGIGMGTVFGFHALSEWSDSNAACPHEMCTVAGASAASSAKTSAQVANVAIVMGAAALAGGATLWILGSSTASSSVPTVAARAEGGPAGADVVVEGHW